MQTGEILRHVWINLTVGALKPGVRNECRSPMAGTCNIQDVEITGLDHPIEMGVDQIQSGTCAPMTEQPRFDVFDRQRLFQ